MSNEIMGSNCEGKRQLIAAVTSAGAGFIH